MNLADDLFQLFLQPGDRVLDARFILRRQLVVIVRAHHLVIPGRRKREAVRRAQQHDALFAGFVAHLAERMGLALAVFLVDLVQAALVFLALEHCRNHGLELGHQLLHVGMQAPPPSRRAAGLRAVCAAV